MPEQHNIRKTFDLVQKSIPLLEFSLLTRALLRDGEEEELEPLGEGEDERVPVHHQREPRTRLVQRRRRRRTLWT